ncbi:hypothetical protein NW754_001369 [Fusarium falciforme]|nr:hypothetical protein NW754_001369 [Fusarium falciforme]
MPFSPPLVSPSTSTPTSTPIPSAFSRLAVRDVSNDRMAKAGVNTRHTPGSKEIFPWADKRMPLMGHLIRAHGAAVKNGALSPGQEEILG